MQNALKNWWAQALQNKIIAMVLAMIVVVPLIASPAGSRVQGLAAVAFEGFALLLVVALFWRTRWDLRREQVTTFLRTGANAPVLLLAALLVISCIAVPFKGIGIQETLRIGAGILLYFVVAYQFRQSKHLSMLADTILFLAVAVSFIGMSQYQLAPEARGTALFGNQQLLGSLLMLLLPLVTVIALHEKASPKRQLVGQFAAVMTASCLLLVQTRSSWLGAAVAMIVLGALAYLANRKDNSQVKAASHAVPLAAQKHKLVVPVVLAVVTVGFVGLAAMQNSNLVERASSFSNLSHDLSFQERHQQWWAGAVEMVKARPLTGWGIGQFPMFQNKFTGMGEAFGGHSISLAEQAHNFYLQTAAELGLPGLLLVLAVLGSFLVTGSRRVTSMDAGIRRSLLIGSIAATVAFMVDAASSPAWQFGQVSMFLWLAMGIGVACMRPRPKRQMNDEVVYHQPAILGRVARPAFAVLAALVMATLVLPTTNAVADSDYNDNDIEKLALYTGAGILLLDYFSDEFNLIFGDDKKDDEPTTVLGTYPPPAN
jgi:O-antigen ligase